MIKDSDNIVDAEHLALRRRVGLKKHLTIHEPRLGVRQGCSAKTPAHGLPFRGFCVFPIIVNDAESAVEEAGSAARSAARSAGSVARVIIDCSDYSHRASVRGGAYGKWIFFDPGSLGWHTGEYYCENEWQ